jgi:hypothetical protein
MNRYIRFIIDEDLPQEVSQVIDNTGQMETNGVKVEGETKDDY